MKSDDLLEAIGDLDDELILSAQRNPRNMIRWVRWTAAACLCLVVSGAVLAFWLQSGLGASVHLDHNVIPTDTGAYYTSQHVYYYDRQTQQSSLVSLRNGTLTQTRSGVYLLTHLFHHLYRIDGSKLTYCGKLHDDNLLEVVEGKAYHRIDGHIEQIDLKTGAVTRLGEATAKTDGVLGNIVMFGTRVYYDVSLDGKYVIHTFVPGKAGSHQEYPLEQGVHVEKFFEDFALLESERGLYRLDYGTWEQEFLCEYAPNTGALDYYGGTLYFVAEFRSEQGYGEPALVSLNPYTKAFEILRPLYHGDGTATTITEIEVCEDGYYYTDPSATEGGLFFHAFSDGSETCIRRHGTPKGNVN